VGSSKAESFPCGDPDVVCPEGSALPQPVAAGAYSVNGVCPDRWPSRLRAETVFDDAGLRANAAVWTAAELEHVLQDPAWAAGAGWTLQATVSSTCPHPVAFGFGGGSGTLRVTVPAFATDATLRVHGNVDASFARDGPQDAPTTATNAKAGSFVAFDRCGGGGGGDETSSAARVTFHEVRLGVGECPGFAAPPLGPCVEARWAETTAFEAPRNAFEAVRAEGTSLPRSAVVQYLAPRREWAP
jgi:hypothetical protein